MELLKEVLDSSFAGSDLSAEERGRLVDMYLAYKDACGTFDKFFIRVSESNQNRQHAFLVCGSLSVK